MQTWGGFGATRTSCTPRMRSRGPRGNRVEEENADQSEADGGDEQRDELSETLLLHLASCAASLFQWCSLLPLA
jgi:hypothetical protein